MKPDGAASIPDKAANDAFTQAADFVQQLEALSLNADDVEVTWAKTSEGESDRLIFFDVDRMISYPGIGCDERGDFSTVGEVFRKVGPTKTKVAKWNLSRWNQDTAKC